MLKAIKKAKKFATKGLAKPNCTIIKTKIKFTIDANAPMTRK